MDLWLATATNRNSSAATCGTGDGDLTMNSYSFILKAVEGTVSWSSYTNQISSFTLVLESGSSATDLYGGYASAAALQPGLYHLGVVDVTPESGTPDIIFASSTTLSGAALTGFGAQCSGQDGDNTLKLGSDWHDSDGVSWPGEGGNMAPEISAPGGLSSLEGGILEVTVSATDPDNDNLTLAPENVPEGFTVVSQNGAGTAQITLSGRLPIDASDEGYLELGWVASDGVNAAVHATTQVQVEELTMPDLGASFGYAQSRVLVRFRPGVVTGSPASGKGATEEFSFATEQATEALATAGVTNLEQLLPGFSVNATDIHGNPITLPEDLSDLYVADLVDSSVAAAVAILRTDSLDIRNAEPNFIGLSCRHREASEQSLVSLPPSFKLAPAWGTTVPNDSLFGHQWWLRNTGQVPGGFPGMDIRASGAWNVTTGGSGSAYVAVLSTGIDGSHPDLGYSSSGPNFISGSGSAEDDDPLSEGTADAGIVGGRGNNVKGIAGANWHPSLAMVKMLDANGQTVESAFIQSINWARQNAFPVAYPNVHFLNQSDNMAAAVKNAHASGMLLVAPTGVEDSDAPFWPASYGRLVEGVGAVTESGARWRNSTDLICPVADGLGSNFGTHQVKLAGPGGNRIVTTKRTSLGSYYDIQGGCYYAERAGTAGAAAAVAGVATLVQSMALNLSGEDLAQILEHTARDIGGAGIDPDFGFGLVDAEAAVGFLNNANVVDRGSTSSVVNLGIVGTPQIRLIDVPPPADASTNYNTKQYEIRANIVFSQPFVSPPTVWGRNANSIGWRNHPNNSTRRHLEEPVGWCEVVPGSVTRTGCTLRTFVYDVYTALGGHLAWYPVQPNGSNITLAYTAVGPANATGVEASAAPQVFKVAQQPNPLVSKGEFSLALPAGTRVRLGVYDVGGRLVRQLANGFFPPGVHRIPWSVSDPKGPRLATGVYFYKLSSGLGERSGKVLVVR